MAAYIYLEDENPYGESIPGVPLRDIECEELESYPRHVRRSIEASPMYRPTVAASSIRQADEQAIAEEEQAQAQAQKEAEEQREQEQRERAARIKRFEQLRVSRATTRSPAEEPATAASEEPTEKEARPRRRQSQAEGPESKEA